MFSNKFICFGLVSLATFSLAFRVSAADTQQKTRILIVPGHEPTYGGAEFGKTKERNLVVELGQDLEKLLRADSTYKVYITRDTKSWTPVFEDYFNNNSVAIAGWQKQARQSMSHLVSIGSTTRSIAPLIHNKAETDVGTRLYGVIKWANEHVMDLVIHIHLNDDPVHAYRKPGKFSGFTIYVPSSEYSNSTTTRAVASALFKRLSKYNPVSNLKQESDGIIEDPDLIAIGANNTSKVPSLLIEYDYLYASQLTDSNLRSLVLKDLAYQTYLGLQDFFGKDGMSVPGSYDSSLLPYLWRGSVTSTSTSPEIYALQTALMATGDYPPQGKTKNDCPRSGIFGSCTKNALKTFQKKQGIIDEKDFAGTETITALQGGI